MSPRAKPKPTHGGAREGAGRPPLPGGGSIIRPVTLTAATIARVERWQRTHKLASFSAALRSIIEAAS